MSIEVDALVVGAGPAGLMAAEMLMAPGRRVLVAEAMPSPARKFLMAGKSGLNLTKDEPAPAFRAAFSGSASVRLEDGFGPDQVKSWAEGLGIALFTGSTGRVFPVGMKASPLLRAWLARLESGGVTLRRRWRLEGIEDGFRFATPEGPVLVRPRVAVLAMGGASWPRLGSDGAWQGMLERAGVPVAPFRPANMGFRVAWSSAMARHFGAAVKGVAIRAGAQVSRGEWVIARAGIEGGGVYAVAAAIRDGAAPVLDLAPDLDLPMLTRRFARPRGRLSVGNWLRRVLGDPVRAALLMEWARPLPASEDAPDWAARAKALAMPLAGPMGLDRAISSAGGITADALAPGLELKALPGIFAAGEMLDWEAPTGGYLLTGCLASGRRAGLAAAARLGPAPPEG